MASRRAHNHKRAGRRWQTGQFAAPPGPTSDQMARTGERRQAAAGVTELLSYTSLRLCNTTSTGDGDRSALRTRKYLGFNRDFLRAPPRRLFAIFGPLHVDASANNETHRL